MILQWQVKLQGEGRGGTAARVPAAPGAADGVQPPINDFHSLPAMDLRSPVATAPRERKNGL